MKILVIDDSEGLRRVLTALLVSAGHQVIALADGDAVEATIAREAPDTIFLDYRLPGRDGLAVLAAVQAVAADIDVLFMTADDAPEIAQRAADAGAVGFIRKPFDQQRILAELAEVAAMRARVRAAAGQQADAPAIPASNVIRGERPRTAVIADDSSAIRALLKSLLEVAGIHVVQAVGNGVEAIAAARRHQPGLLCLDVNMPEMSGLEALEAAREACPGTAVVMVTGCADRDFVVQAAALGARGYILKPLRPAYIENFVRKLYVDTP